MKPKERYYSCLYRTITQQGDHEQKTSGFPFYSPDPFSIIPGKTIEPLDHCGTVPMMKIPCH